jgi:hypothetical protein
VNIQDLLSGGGVERVDSLSDTSTDSFRVVVVESSGNTLLLVDLLGLGNNSVGVLVQFTRNSLVLTDNLASDSVVNTVEEVEESARDALLFWTSAKAGIDPDSVSLRSKSIARWTMWSPRTYPWARYSATIAAWKSVASGFDRGDTCSRLILLG